MIITIGRHVYEVLNEHELARFCLCWRAGELHCWRWRVK